MHQQEQWHLGAFFGREQQQNGRQGQENVPPVVASGGTNADGGASLHPPVNNMPFCHAELQKNIHNLHELWLEYECGSGGQKPAKFFTPQERGLLSRSTRISFASAKSSGIVFEST